MLDQQHDFTELISPYLRNLISSVEKEFGKDSKEYNALRYQYLKTNDELLSTKEHNSKHYEAGFNENSSLRFMERLYKRQATIDITLACAAHCRYCLRQNYELGVMTESDMKELGHTLSQDKYLKEILLTGGDPLLAYKQLIPLMEYIINLAPNIQIIRIGSRLPVQAPNLMPEEIYNFFTKNRGKVVFELGMQINHTIELQPEARECIKKIQATGVHVYAQNVLLKDVNDDIESLISLYDELRYMNIEAHYLFHPVPIEGTHRFRMSISRFLEFARLLTSSGEIPGRSKPMFSLMTDVGKCTLYSGCVGEKKGSYYDIFTGYQLGERQKWHKGYQLPDSAYEDENGYIHVKYLDGEQ